MSRITSSSAYRGCALALAVGALFSLAPAFAQSGQDDQTIQDKTGGTGKPDVLTRNGFQLSAISGSFGYSPIGDYSTRLSGAGSIPGNVYASGTLDVGYAFSNTVNQITFLYRPTYYNRPGSQAYSKLDQSGRIDYTRRLIDRLTLHASGSVDYIGFEQLLFGSTVAELGGASTTVQAMAAVRASASGSPVAAPFTWIVYGNRVLSLNATTGVTYQYSPRLSFNVSGSFSKAEGRDDGSDPNRPASLILGDSRFIETSSGFQYALSPASELSFQTEIMHARGFTDTYQTYTFTGGYGRRLRRNLYIYGQAGAGRYESQLAGKTGLGGTNWVGGGSLLYNARSYSVGMDVTRSVSNTFGLAARSATGANGTWRWTRPGWNWSFFGTGGAQFLEATEIPTFRVWTVGAGLSRRFGTHTLVSIQYVCLIDDVKPVGGYMPLTANAISMTFSWSPGAAGTSRGLVR